MFTVLRAYLADGGRLAVNIALNQFLENSAVPAQE